MLVKSFTLWYFFLPRSAGEQVETEGQQQEGMEQEDELNKSEEEKAEKESLEKGRKNFRTRMVKK